ncbi:MAG TPA: hypothetical protein VEZ40_06955 [Pyrinomonadaceae bacterium]|nr:hypothetical protein [Pyrinomonadaceae bacterium]
MQDDSTPQSTSPDGTIRVEFDVETGRMSHEIQRPRVLSLPGGEALVDLWGTQWDASARFEEPRTVRLSLRRYPGEKPGFVVTIDARARTFCFADAPGEQHPLTSFKKLIKRKHAAQKPYAPAQTGEPPHRNLSLFVSALLMFAIIFGVLYALGVGWFG